MQCILRGPYVASITAKQTTVQPPGLGHLFWSPKIHNIKNSCCLLRQHCSESFGRSSRWACWARQTLGRITGAKWATRIDCSRCSAMIPPSTRPLKQWPIDLQHLSSRLACIHYPRQGWLCNLSGRLQWFTSKLEARSNTKQFNAGWATAGNCRKRSDTGTQK